MEEQMSEGGNAGNAGQMEEMIGKRSRELSGVTLEEMMQAKADQSRGEVSGMREGVDQEQGRCGADDREPVRAGESEQQDADGGSERGDGEDKRGKNVEGETGP
jgi:hypothetical protein